MTQPYSWILNVWAAWCSQIFLRNIGTYASPLSLGKERVDLQPRTRVTTVATVTSVWHWFVTGNSIFVVVSSDTGAITVSAKTITSIPTADTFTFYLFECLSYYWYYKLFWYYLFTVIYYSLSSSCKLSIYKDVMHHTQEVTYIQLIIQVLI